MFSSSLDLVYVFATVEGKDGALVTDLASQDFVVRDDGMAQPVQTFARTADLQGTTPLDLHVVLLLDVSTSMSANVKLSREAATSFLDAIPRAQELFVGLFENQVRVRRYSPEGRDVMRAWLNDNEPAGGTALYDSVDAVLTALGPPAGQQVIVLMTDGVDENSQLRLSDLLQRLRASSVTVESIAFQPVHPPWTPQSKAPNRKAFDERYELVARTAADALRSMSDVTGGSVFHPRSAADLPSIYGRILTELSSQYVIGFAPDTTTRKSKLHKLTVEVKRPGLRVRHRAGYLPAAAPAR